MIAVHDNLDLFIPQFQMMKDTGTFFSHGKDVPFLGGISRDVLPSEFSLYTVLYMLLPAYPAYVIGYLLKIVIAVFSCILLARDVCGENYEAYKPLAWVLGTELTGRALPSTVLTKSFDYLMIMLLLLIV